MTTNRQWIVARRPAGQLQASDFELVETPVPSPEDGQVLCRNLWLSIDAANRAWLQGRTYRDVIEAGEVMGGFGIGQVLESRSVDLHAGDLVEGELGWQEYVALPAKGVARIDPKGPIQHRLSVLGITGLTAYLGLRDVGHPQPGETVVVSAAAGATGNLTGQLARRWGCRAVGICGSADKAAWLTGELRFDAAVNHRDPEFGSALKAACPAGVDVYFDNVGGDVLEAVLRRMNVHGRIVCCGAVSQYDTANPAAGPRGVPGLLVTKRIRMEGFLVSDLFAHRDDALRDLEAWIADGSLVVTEDVATGVESLPDALLRLLAGRNVGKQMVHLADPTT